MRISNHKVETSSLHNYNVYLEEYSNIHEFVSTIDSRPYNSWATGGHQHPPKNKDLEELMYGWKEFTDELKVELEKSENIKTRDKALKQKVYAIKGYYPNVGKALRGNQKCMGRYNKVRVSTKIVEIIWDCGAAAREKAGTIKTQGVKLLAKIKELELMGFRVRLMVQGFKGRTDDINNSYMARIVLKDENQPLDLMRISYPLANVEMLRTWMFHWYEHLPNAEYIDGYGVSLYLWKQQEREALLKAVNVKPNQYYINLNTDIDSTFKKLEGGK